MPTRTTEEELRERLLDLENRRSEEERRRLETESILAGLQILSNEGTSNLFECLLTTLQPAFGFDAAIVIKSSALDDIWEPIHATHDHLSVIKWTPGSFFKRVMTGSAAATFDASMISEWRKQPDDIRQQYTSLLAIPLSFDHTNPTVLIFLSRQPHAF
ncbi:MAG: hypothetical protein U9N14_01440, partial [Pseudomonadota bacterium]|nr:hypothetical protein [Pseudomonadota bacterium]